MTWQRALVDLRREMITRMEIALSNVIGVSLTAKASEIGEGDAVEKSDDDVDPDTRQRGQRPVVRTTPWGVAGRPPKGIRGAWLRLGASNVLFIGILPNEGYGPQDLEDGETAFYNKVSDCVIRLLEDGQIDIGTPSGKKVMLQGGGKGVARLDDTVAANTNMATWIGNITTAVNTLAPGSATAPTDFGKINSASSKTETG